MKKLAHVVIYVSVTVGLSVSTRPNAQVASTPPMGWNSWHSYGLTITEAQFRENVRFSATS